MNLLFTFDILCLLFHLTCNKFTSFCFVQFTGDSLFGSEKKLEHAKKHIQYAHSFSKHSKRFHWLADIYNLLFAYHSYSISRALSLFLFLSIPNCSATS